MSLFNQIGIMGWEEIEATIVSAIIAKKPILFVGKPGANKTEAASILANSFQDNAIFRSYDVPALSPEDLMGVFNPADLNKGQLGFVKTPLSAWDATAILLDEINCANPFTQSKLHELIRVKEIMGLKTNIELVFAAVNPPTEFQTNYMSLPLTSRFVVVTIPDAKNMSEDTLNRILNSDKVSKKLASKVKAARDFKISEDTLKSINNLSIEIFKTLHSSHNLLSFEGRSLKNIRDLIIGFFKAKKSFNSLHVDDNSLMNLVLATVADIQPVVRKLNNTAKYDDVKASVYNRIATLTIKDPDVKVYPSLDEIIKESKVMDEMDLLQQAVNFLDEETDIGELKKARRKLKDSPLSKQIRSQLRSKMLHRKNTLLINDPQGHVLNASYLKRF